MPQFAKAEAIILFFGYNRAYGGLSESIDNHISAPINFLKADVRVFCY